MIYKEIFHPIESKIFIFMFIHSFSINGNFIYIKEGEKQTLVK